MKRLATGIFVAGTFIGGSGVLSTATQAATPGFPRAGEYEFVTQSVDESDLAMCRPGSLIDQADSPLFDSTMGPRAATPLDAAEQFIAEIADASTAKNPGLGDLPREQQDAYLKWFEADFQPARSLSVGEQRSSRGSRTDFARAIGDDLYDVHIIVERHVNGNYFVDSATICADAIHDRDFETDAPSFVFDDGRQPADQKNPERGD